MSVKQFEAFYEKVMKDEGLRDQLAALKDDMKGAHAKVAEIARNAGFDVSTEDIAKSVSFGDKADAEIMEGNRVGCSSVCGEICGMHLGHYLGQQH